MPGEEACILGQEGEDLEENELEEVAGEGEDEAEEDLRDSAGGVSPTAPPGSLSPPPRR